MNKKIAIIGSGIGGLSIAARLLSKGFKVDIYEKNSTIGGKVNVLKYKNFTFDLTASIMLFPKDYFDVFTYCKKNYKDYFKVSPISPVYRCFFYDGSYYDFSNHLPHLNKTLNKITEGNNKDIIGYHKFINNNYKKYLISNKYYFNRPFFSISSLLNPLNLIKLLELQTSTSSFDNCKKYISNKKLIEYLMFQTMYIGVSPYTSASIYNITPAFTQMEGLYYIKGGMYNYINALKNLVLELGGNIHTLSNVEKILFSKNRAIGLIVNNKEIYSDIVVCDSDYSYTIESLIDTRNIRSVKKTLKDMDYSCSTFILYLALNKKYPVLKVNNILINDNFKKNINAAFKNHMPSKPSLYIYCPSSIDDSLCPAGCETINVMLRVPNTSNTRLKWNTSNIKHLKELLLDELSKLKGLTDIKDHIIFSDFLTPIDLRDRFNSYNGTAFGLSHTNFQTTVFRPQCTVPNLKSLYFVGSSIHPGNGVSMVLKSSKICTQKIIKDCSKK